MDIAQVKQSIRGPLAPVLTVYKEDLSLDLDAIQENVDQQIRRGMTKGRGVLLAAGAGGDFPLLRYNERKAVIKAVAEVADGRATILACTQSPLTAEAIELSEWAQQTGCYGIQLSPPWYYDPIEKQIYDSYKAVSQSIDICIMVYHTPWLGSHISVGLFKRMWEDLPNVRAIKWAADGEGETLMGYAELADKYAMVNNGAGCLDAALLGGNGYVTHLANVWPEHEVAFWELASGGNCEQAIQEYRNVLRPWRAMRSWAANEIGGGESFVVKPAAEMAGFHGGPSRPPMVTLNAEQRAHVRTVLEEIGVPLV